MITYRDAHARYPGASDDVFAEVSFDVPGGAITALVGPNGSGKSSLVRALLRRLPLHRGEIAVDDRPVADWPLRKLASRIAIITQREEPAFPIPVREYVALGRYPLLGEWAQPGESDHAAIEAAMSITQVDSMADRRIDTLSGGEWQRVRLARALAQGGSAMILDEPTTFLDVAHEMAVFELMASLARERRQAVLLVSHQLNLVSRYADHMILLDHGRVVAAGAPADVMQGETLERVYDWPLVVVRDPAVGAPMLVPLRSRRR